mgnify:FL=1
MSELATADAGLERLMLSQRHHGAHHRPPFNRRYCTVANLVNPVADRLGLFETIERLVEETIGAERRQDTGERPATILQL